MKLTDNDFFRYHIVADCRSNKFNFETNYYALDFWDQQWLKRYAEIFKIRPHNGIEPERWLWYKCQEAYEREGE